MKAIAKKFSLLGIFLLIVSFSGLACTGIMLKASDGTIVRARTMEFGSTLESDIIIAPRGYHFAAAEGASEGLQWTSKYAFVATNPLGMPAAVDGVNEKGLSGGIFYFPGYASFSPPSAEKKTLGSWDVVTYALSLAATAEEAADIVIKAGVSSFKVPQWGIVPPTHYFFADASGKAVVLEITANGPKVFPSPLGVITNAPTYDWHMTNLATYVGISDMLPAPEKVGSVVVSAFGQGAGMRGLPGDFTPPSRFVRAVVFSSTALPSPTAQDAVLTAFHLLNNFDIPKGAVRSVDKGKQTSEYTEWTSASDVTHRRFYVRTFQDSNIRMVDLMRSNLDAKDIVTIKLNQQEKITDFTPSGK
jgi:choloylglycine hydrolase